MPDAPTKESGFAKVEGTVPSAWYLEMKAERNALRGVLEQIAAEEPGKPGVPTLYAHQARHLAMAALERFK